MDEFRDLTEFLVVEPLVLPIGGKRYSFPGEISARTWLRVQTLQSEVQTADETKEVVSDAEQENLMSELCGETRFEMVADGVTSEQLKRVLGTLMTFHLYGRKAAQKKWETVGNPPAPNRATRRKASPTP